MYSLPANLHRHLPCIRTRRTEVSLIGIPSPGIHVACTESRSILRRGTLYDIMVIGICHRSTLPLHSIGNTCNHKHMRLTVHQSLDFQDHTSREVAFNTWRVSYRVESEIRVFVGITAGIEPEFSDQCRRSPFRQDRKRESLGSRIASSVKLSLLMDTATIGLMLVT